MENTEQTQSQPKKFPLIPAIIILIILLAFVQYLTTRNKTPQNSLIEGYSTSTGEIIVPTQSPVTGTSTNSRATRSTTTSTNTKNNMHTITLETNKGTIVFETYDADAPKTVENFITLANKNFYNGIIFHRVIEGFMIQGGDPTGTGMGGPGYKFADELNPNSESGKKGYVRGTVAMANSGPNTNGSQFFIMHQDNPLPLNYTIFGHVVKGIEVVDAIATVDTNSADRPLQNVTITKVTVAAK